MLFLLNDTLLEAEPRDVANADVVAHLQTLPMQRIVELICEQFLQVPNLPVADPKRAAKAAVMLSVRQPEINAALFIATPRPEGGIRYAHRLAALGAEVIYELKGLRDQGRLTAGVVNALVWEAAGAPQPV